MYTDRQSGPLFRTLQKKGMVVESSVLRVGDFSELIRDPSVSVSRVL